MSVNFESNLWCPRFSKEMNKKYLTWYIIVVTSQFFHFFVRFFGEVRKTKIAFEIIWPLVHTYLHTYNMHVEKLTKQKFEPGAIDYCCLSKNEGIYLILIWDDRYGINVKWVAEFSGENQKLMRLQQNNQHMYRYYKNCLIP